MRTVVIGAGIGGLATAITLRQRGFEAEVFERAPELRPVGAGITLWPNAIRALRKLGVADAVISRGQRIGRGELRTSTGRVLALSEPGEIEARFGEPTIAIHRADLHEALLAALPSSSLHLGRAATAVDAEQGLVTFSDGSSAEGDIVVAADGLHSAVRRLLRPGLAPRYAGYVAWRGVAEAPEHVRAGTNGESWGRGERFGIVAIDARRVYWFATANLPAGRTPSPLENREELLRRFSPWHEPVRDLIDRTPAEAILYNDLFDLEPARGWSQGRVVLLGDAIHATTPNLGQGACMAIESAVVLGRCLAEERDHAAAFARYEELRFPRTRWITEQSWRIGRLGQVSSPLGAAMRDLLLRLAPASAAKKQLMQAAAYEC